MRGVSFPSVWHYACAAGPILSAAITSHLRGAEEWKAWKYRMFNIDFSSIWVWITLGAPFLIYLVAAVINFWIYGTVPPIADFGRSTEFPTWGLLTVGIFQILTFGIGEEGGWRGFLLPALQDRGISPIRATVYLTLFWAFWHTPMFFYREGYLSLGVGGTVGWLISLFAGAIILTWLYNETKSVIVTAFFHAAMNVLFTTPAAAGTVQSVVGAVTMVIAVVLLLVMRKRSLTNQDVNRLIVNYWRGSGVGAKH